MDNKIEAEDLKQQPMSIKENFQDMRSENQIDSATTNQIKAVIYGQCIGDAIGLLTEFMSEDDAKRYYGNTELEYNMKLNDCHRKRWENGDWTDDSDQMILILESLIDEGGNVKPQTFAKKLKRWIYHGFQELGDNGGLGIGQLTMNVIKEPEFEREPQEISKKVWEDSGCYSAPNGGVMRTSIMGVHQFWDTAKVIENAVTMCTVTHHDQRCEASVVAVSVAISLMLQRKYYDGDHFNVTDIIQESFKCACSRLSDPRSHENKEELKKYMFCEDIAKLQLAERDSIGYTFKCVGAGFWALKQDNFRQAIQTVVMNAGDADTNGAVAGALLGCKLGGASLPDTWLSGLIHKTWLDKKVDRYLMLLDQMYIHNMDTSSKNY